MQLKRIDIYGFKSFAEKCTITFPPGISAVVGPNGCGKSNIIDAIKWVMGEQSVKQLRGKSMGDIIFSGTEKKAPVNMAEVSLTISGLSDHENSPASNWEEVMVTRRLYRSGESLYMINKQPCRLKDISDIFLRCGMGARSCAIIQQGNIGAITDATAEERRSFIEEAAGVMRYKARRHEALSRVSSARQNLERINDILDEIGRQLEALRREAETAKLYNHRLNRLRESDMLISVYYYQDYERKIRESRQRLQRLRDKDVLGTESIEELNAALMEIENRTTRKEKQLADLRGKRAELQRSKDRLENQIHNLKNEIARLEKEKIQIDQSLQKALVKNQQLETEITQAKEKNINLEIEIKKLQSKSEQQEVSSKKDRHQLEGLRKDREALNKKMTDLWGRKAKYNNICQTAASNKDQIKRRMDRTAAEIAQSTDQIAQLEETCSKQQKQHQSLKKNQGKLLKNAEDCRQLLKEQSRQLNNQIKAVSELQQQRAREKSQLGILKRMESNFEWYKDGVRALMTARNNPDQEGNDFNTFKTFEIIGDLIEPEPGYEHAAEAALGEALQYIVLGSIEQALKAIDYLKAGNAGRSGFISLKNCTPTSEGFKKSLSSARLKDITPLIKHIGVRNGFENLIFKLLGDVGVCNDLKTGLSIIDMQKTYRILVTRQGDMAAPGGMAVGGSKDRLAGILEKKQEIRQLEQSLEKTEKELEIAKDIQQSLEKEVRENENRLAQLTRDHHKCQAQFAELDKQLFKTETDLNQARRRLEVSTLEQKRLKGEKQDISQELSAHNKILSEISDEISSVESKISAQDKQIKNLEQQIRAMENNLVDTRLMLTRRGAELENTQSTIEKLESFQKETAGRISELQKEIEEKKQRTVQAENELKDHQQKMQSLSRQLSDTTTILKQEQSDYQGLVDRHKKTDETISGTRSELDQVRRKIHQLELDLSGLSINQENVVNRFLEKYADSFDKVRQTYISRIQAADFSIEKTEKTRAELKQKIETMGEVNLGAIEACQAQKQRYDFLSGHRDDLVEALGDLENVIRKINKITKKLFTETFEAVNAQFSSLFPKLFNGGSAWLELTEPEKPMETGVELMIHPPGKKVTRLSLLSGGEKALSAIAFIFSIFFLNPAAFCLLDEIDAPLDDVNVERFNELLRIVGENTQIIMISHNRKTMEFSDMLFGVTMAGSGISRVISVNIQEALNISDQNKDVNNTKGNDHAPALN